MGADSSIDENFEVSRHFNDFISLVSGMNSIKCENFDTIINDLEKQANNFFQVYERLIDAGKIGGEGIDINLYFKKIEHAINSFKECLSFIRNSSSPEEKNIASAYFRNDLRQFINQITNLISISTDLLYKILSNPEPYVMTQFYLELSLFDFSLNVQNSDKPPYYTMSQIPCYNLRDQIDSTKDTKVNINAPHASGKTSLVPLRIASRILKNKRPYFIIVIEHQTSMIVSLKNLYRHICTNDKELKAKDTEGENEEEEDQYDEDDDSIMITSSLRHITELSDEILFLPIISILSPIDALRLIHSVSDIDKFVERTVFIIDDIQMRNVETDILVQDIYQEIIKTKFSFSGSFRKSGSLKKTKTVPYEIHLVLMSTVPDVPLLNFIEDIQNIPIENVPHHDVIKKAIICNSISEITGVKLFNEMKKFFKSSIEAKERKEIGSMIVFVPNESIGHRLYKNIFKYYSNDNAVEICPLDLTLRRKEKVDDFYNRLYGQMIIQEGTRPEGVKPLFLLPIDATGIISQEEKRLIQSQLPLPFHNKLSRIFITTPKNENLFEIKDLKTIFDTGIVEVEYFNPDQNAVHIQQELLPQIFLDEHYKMLGSFGKGTYYQFNVAETERPSEIIPLVKRSDISRQLLLLRNFGIKLEEQDNLPDELNHDIRDKSVSLLQKIGIIDATEEKELTPIGKEAAKFASVSPFFALATAKFTENQQFAFLCSLIIENSRKLVLNAQSKILCKHFERESDVVTLLEAICEISESTPAEDENLGLSIGTIYSIYSLIENAFEDVKNGRKSVVDAVKWAREQPGGTLAMVDKFVLLLPQEEFIKNRKASFMHVLGTGIGSEPTLVYKAKEIFKFKNEEGGGEEQATIKFARRPGWLGLQTPGKIIVLSLIVEDESKLIRGGLIHHNASCKKPNQGIVSFEVNNPSLNSFFFVSLFEAYWEGHEMFNEFVGIYHTPEPKKESAFLIHMTNNDDRIYLNYCPRSKNVDDLMKSAIPLLSSLMPFVARSIIAKLETPLCALEINGYGCSNYIQSFIHLIDEPEMISHIPYPVNKATLEFANNNINELMKTMPSIRFAITGESFYYKYVNGREVEADLTYPNVSSLIKSVFDPHVSSHLVLLVDKNYPNKPPVPPLTWVPPAGTEVAAPEDDKETDTRTNQMIIDAASKIMTGFGYAHRSSDIFFVTLGGGFPNAAKMIDGSQVPEEIRGNIGYTPEENGAFKFGIYPLVRYFMSNFTKKQKLTGPIPILELGSTNSWPNYPTNDAQREALLNEINKKLKDHFHLKEEVQTSFFGTSMLGIRIEGLPEDMASHKVTDNVWDVDYQLCKADTEIMNVLRGIGTVDLQVSTIVHEPTINIYIQHMHRFAVSGDEFIERVQNLADKFGFLRMVNAEYIEGSLNLDEEEQGVIGRTNVELLGISTGIVFSTLITKEFKLNLNNNDIMESTIAGCKAIEKIYPHLGPAPSVGMRRVVKIAPSEVEALKEKIATLDSSRGKKKWNVDSTFNILIVPASEDAKLRELMQQVRNKDENIACMYICEPPQKLLPQSLYVYQQDKSVRALGVCQPCMVEFFRENEDFNFVIDPITKMVNRKKLSQLPEGLKGFPLTEEGTEVDGVFWPQVPFAQATWTLMSGPDELQKYVKAWITIIIDFVIRKAQNFFTFCPNHPDIIYRTPKPGLKKLCPFCDMMYCGDCMSWHRLTDLCAVEPPGMKRCPNCHVPTFKYDGCNHITCPCGKHWCYYCGSASPIFNTGSECYTHMTNAHGGYYT